MVAMRRLALVLCGVLVAVAGCTASLQTRERDTEARIEAFLLSLRTGQDGFGWNLLKDWARAAYPGGGNAWIAAIESTDTSGLTWSIDDVMVDDFVGCARVTLEPRDAIPFTLYDDSLPAAARVATSLSSGPFCICAVVGPLPWDAGIRGVG